MGAQKNLRIFPRVLETEKAMKKAAAVFLLLVCAALALAGCSDGRNEKNTTKTTTAATTKATSAQTTSATTIETTSAFSSETGAETLVPDGSTSLPGEGTMAPDMTGGTSEPVTDGLIPSDGSGTSENSNAVPGTGSDGPVESNGGMASGN